LSRLRRQELPLINADTSPWPLAVGRVDAAFVTEADAIGNAVRPAPIAALLSHRWSLRRVNEDAGCALATGTAPERHRGAGGEPGRRRPTDRGLIDRHRLPRVRLKKLGRDAAVGATHARVGARGRGFRRHPRANSLARRWLQVLGLATTGVGAAVKVGTP